MNRRILHVDMDAFFVSVEQVLNPSLKGRPVIVGGDPKGRGVVTSASYEARKFGVRSAMPAAHAYRLCPQAVFVRGSHGRYSEFSRKVVEILETYSPLVEPASIDEAYVDVTGCERLHGPAMNAAQSIRDEIMETLGLPASVGVSSTRLVSKVASKQAKPGGILEVLPGYEAVFLADLPVKALPGVGPKAAETLGMFNIKTIGDLARLDPKSLEKIFGRPGRSLHLRARGVDASPVEPTEAPPKSIGRETTMEKDTRSVERLEGILYALTERVGRSLRRKAFRARSVHLKLRYSDFVTLTRSVTLDDATDMDHVIFREARGMMHRCLDRRVRVRLLGVSVSGLTRDPWQLPLFDRAALLRMHSLYGAVDRIRERYGTGALVVGRAAEYGRGSGSPGGDSAQEGLRGAFLRR